MAKNKSIIINRLHESIRIQIETYHSNRINVKRVHIIPLCL